MILCGFDFTPVDAKRVRVIAGLYQVKEIVGWASLKFQD